jgi:hypothetical protein
MPELSPSDCEIFVGTGRGHDLVWVGTILISISTQLFDAVRPLLSAHVKTRVPVEAVRCRWECRREVELPTHRCKKGHLGGGTKAAVRRLGSQWPRRLFAASGTSGFLEIEST